MPKGPKKKTSFFFFTTFFFALVKRNETETRLTGMKRKRKEKKKKKTEKVNELGKGRGPAKKFLKKQRRESETFRNQPKRQSRNGD